MLCLAEVLGLRSGDNCRDILYPNEDVGMLRPALAAAVLCWWWSSSFTTCGFPLHQGFGVCPRWTGDQDMK